MAFGFGDVQWSYLSTPLKDFWDWRIEVNLHQINSVNTKIFNCKSSLEFVCIYYWVYPPLVICALDSCVTVLWCISKVYPLHCKSHLTHYTPAYTDFTWHQKISTECGLQNISTHLLNETKLIKLSGSQFKHGIK